MQTLNQSDQGAGNSRSAGPLGIYWLAYLLTGHRELSLGVTIEALDLEDEASPFFWTWMRAWSRRLTIARVLAAIRREIAESASRTASKAMEKPALPPPDWALDRTPTKLEFERSLLAIDVFPRCALLLSVFEKVPLGDAATLLNADRDLVRKAKTAALRELTRNLAEAQGWTSTSANPYVMTRETQHA